MVVPCHHEQVPPLAVGLVLLLMDKTQQRLFPGRAEAFGGPSVPVHACRQCTQEGIELRQSRNIQFHGKAASPGRGQLHEQDQHEQGQAAGRHAVFEHLAQGLAEIVCEDSLILKTHPDPEPEPDDERHARVDPILHHKFQCLHEDQRQQHEHIGADHRRGNSNQERRHFGQESQPEEDEPDIHADAARPDSGHFGQRQAV